MNLYPIDPVPFDNLVEWLARHQQLHTDMNGVLGLQGVDLTQVNFADPQQLVDWAYSNYQEHFSAAAALGI